MDADAVTAERPVSAILDEFAEPGPAVLVGTQMIAKGHDFADVELVVVIDADTALAIPDFRAEERAFMLVAQVAGRAGRSAESAQWARVIVQTWQPDSSHLARALTHDVEGYLDDELARRKPLGYPPFSRIVRVLISVPSPSNPDAARSTRSMQALSRWSGAVREGLQRLEIGPVSHPSDLLRIGSRDRVQVLLKTTGDTAGAARALRAFLARTQNERSRSDVRIVVDVDPQSVV
jgi:primosomal protein N' (replication factor Y)